MAKRPGRMSAGFSFFGAAATAFAAAFAADLGGAFGTALPRAATALAGFLPRAAALAFLGAFFVAFFFRAIGVSSVRHFDCHGRWQNLFKWSIFQNRWTDGEPPLMFCMTILFLAEADMSTTPKKPMKYRSQAWFDNPSNADMTALYIERYLNYGFTQGELQGGKPIIGIAQTGSDLSPCNRAHVDWVRRVREGITRGGRHSRLNSPCIRFKKPASALPPRWTGISPISGWWRVLYGYPLDGVVLTTGCDKTTPACLMAAATVEYSGHRALRGPDAQRLTSRASAPAPARWCGKPRDDGSQPAKIDYDKLHRAGGLLRPFGGLLQHHGHRHHHEQRSPKAAGHVACRAMRRDSRALPRARPDFV